MHSKQDFVSAVENRNLIVFGYREKLRIVQPLSVEDTVDRHVVLKAREILETDVKSFRTDRMQGVVITPAVFPTQEAQPAGRGWTRPLVNMLRELKLKVEYPQDNEISRFENLPHGALVTVRAMYPKIGDSAQNDGPTIDELLKIGSEFYGTLFEGYVVGDGREDEDFMIDAIAIPTVTVTTIELAELVGSWSPDEVGTVKIGNLKYVRLWWD